MRRAVFFSLLAVATILAMTACGGSEPVRQAETAGGTAPAPLTPLPAVPSRTPTPSATLTPPPLPSREQISLQFEQSILPLVDRLEQAPTAPIDLDLPPLEEIQIVLVPDTEHLYFIQSVLYPDLLPGVTGGKAILYLLYSYQRGQDLSYSPFSSVADTQEVYVQLLQVAEFDGQAYILKTSFGVGGSGSQDERELVTSALDNHNLMALLGTHTMDVVDQLETIVGYASGINWSTQTSPLQQLALLERALDSEHWSDRARAVFSLGTLGAAAKDSLPALIEAIRFGSFMTTLEAINKVKPGTIDPEQHKNQAYLSKALDSPEWETRATAATLLAVNYWESCPAIPRLQALLADAQVEVRTAAAWALGQCGAKAASATPALVLALGDEHATLRENAAAALGRIGAELDQAVPALVLTLKDRDPQVRAAAAWALGNFGPAAAEAVPTLEQALGDDFSQVRRSAAESLGMIGPAATAALTRLLVTIAADVSATVRMEAIQAAPLIAPDSAETIAALALALSDPNSMVRLAVTRELGKLGDKAIAAVPALIATLQDPADLIRATAHQALTDITGQDLPPETGAWQKWWQEQ